MHFFSPICNNAYCKVSLFNLYNAPHDLSHLCTNWCWYCYTLQRKNPWHLLSYFCVFYKQNHNLLHCFVPFYFVCIIFYSALIVLLFSVCTSYYWISREQRWEKIKVLGKANYQRPCMNFISFVLWVRYGLRRQIKHPKRVRVCFFFLFLNELFLKFNLKDVIYRTNLLMKNTKSVFTVYTVNTLGVILYRTIIG